MINQIGLDIGLDAKFMILCDFKACLCGIFNLTAAILKIVSQNEVEGGKN